MSESKTDINNLPTNNQEDKRASNFNVPKNQEIKLTPEQETAKEEMIIELSEGKIERALEIKERSNLSEETAQAAAKEGMIKQLSKQATQYVLGIKEKFNVSEEITQEVIKEVIIEKLSGGNIYAALEIKDNFERLNISDDVSEEIIDSPEIQKAIKKAIIKEMDNGSIFQPLRLIRELKILKLKDFISSSEFQKAAKKAAAKTLLLSERNSDKYIKELDALGGNIISSSEFQKAAKEEIIKGLNNEHIHAALRIKKEFNISEEVIGSPEIQKAAKKGIIRELRLKKVRDIYPQKVDRALLIKKEFNVPKEVIDSAEVQKVIKEEIIEYLNNDSVIQALEMKEGFNVPKEVIDSPEIQKIVEKIILERLSKKDPYSIKKLKKEFNVPEEKFKKLIQQGIRRELSQGNIDNAFEIMEESNIPKSFIDLPETQETIRQGMIKKLFDFKFREALLLKNEFNIPVIDINQKEFFKYVGEEKYTLEYIQNTIDMGIEKEIIQITDPNLENLIRNPKLRETLCLNELQQILKNNPDIELSELEKNVYQYKAEALESEGFLEELDQKAFQKLSDEFGSAEIAKFIGLEDRSAIHILKPNITKLYNKIKNQIGKKQFIGNILNQVQMDTSNYGENNVNDNYDFDYDDNYDYNNYENIDSYTQFNNIIGNLDYDFKKTLDEANKFSNPELQKLVKELAEKHPCSSWENMKKYNEICIILKDKEILEKLEVLNQEGKFKQYEFFSKLAFHPTSKISTTKVFEFMNNPAHFLDVEDAHSGKSHERKKPSNYIHFPHLDISAEDLRDALIEGDLDNLQYFPKSEIKYSFSNEEMEADELIDSLIKSFGRKYNGVKGIQRAKNVKEMFARVNQLCKENNLNIKELAQGSPDILKKITPELKQGLEELLFNEKIGIKDKRKKEEYIVKVHPKSSPQGHLAGNDTACCMPFGSGKNNVYMYNLGCAIMTIQKVNQDGTARTVTQSVLTPDVDIEQKVSELINKLESSRGKIHELIKSDLSQNQEIIITADNIEVAENYKGKKEKI